MASNRWLILAVLCLAPVAFAKKAKKKDDADKKAEAGWDYRVMVAALDAVYKALLDFRRAQYRIGATTRQFDYTALQ